jgi:hypothetical protein
MHFETYFYKLVLLSKHIYIYVYMELVQEVIEWNLQIGEFTTADDILSDFNFCRIKNTYFVVLQNLNSKSMHFETYFYKLVLLSKHTHIYIYIYIYIYGYGYVYMELVQEVIRWNLQTCEFTRNSWWHFKWFQFLSY